MLENALSFVQDSYSCSAVMTAADEILSNIEKYAFLKSTDMIIFSADIDQESGFLRMRFEYGGILFDPAEYYRYHAYSTGSREPGGRGILLVGRTMDEFSYRTDNEKNIVEMVKYFRI